jgi:EF-hand domain pair
MIKTEDIRLVFNKYDTDGSGFLEDKECLKCISELGIDVKDVVEFKRFWTEADTNKDNKISFGEFLSWVRVGRNSGSVELMQNEIALIKFFSSIKNSLSDLGKIKPEQGMQDASEIEKVMDFQVSCGESQGKTVIKFEIKTGIKNQIPKMLKLLFMNYNEKEA